MASSDSGDGAIGDVGADGVASHDETRPSDPTSSEQEGAATTGAPGRLGSRMVADVLIYTFARILLVVVMAAAILGIGHVIGVREFPVVVAVLFAIVLALPLGIWVFAPLRRRATASIAVFDERRRRDREQLQARLRGRRDGSG